MLPLQSLTYSLPYILVFILLYVVALPVTTRQGALVNRIPQVQFLFLTLFFFIGLRGYIFTDWKLYLPFWESCPSLWDGFFSIERYLDHGAFSYWEKGFLLYTIVLKSFSNNWIFFQSVSFSIDFIVLYYFFRRYVSNNIFLAFTFWYMFSGVIGLSFSINLMRSAKALLFFLLSIKYVEEKKFVKYLIMNGIGYLFHTSSILLLPLYFVLKSRWNFRFIFTLFLLGNIVYLLQIRWIVPVIDIVANLIGGRLSQLASYYINNSRWNFSYGISIGFMERTATFILLFYLRNKLSAKNAGHVFINIFYLYIFSYLYLSELRILIDRIPIMFVCSYWILLPRLYKNLKKEYKAIFLVSFFFYSLVKGVIAHKDILALYDNMLFQEFTIQERLEMYNLYKSSEYWIN